MLNPEQQAAVDCTDARIACLAGAGSGKTRVLVARVMRLLEEGVYPGEIVCLTFTRKAGREMRERIEAAGVPARTARKLVVSTFHSWAARLLREYADVLGLDPLFTIRDDHDKNDLIRWCAEDLGLKSRTPRTLWRDEKVRARYAELLREAHALDYDSLETELLRLLGTSIGAKLRERYRHVLVDEGQDTSEVQQHILDALDPANLFVVGDPGQSIYAFRGARMDGFVAMTARCGWTVVELTTNYRSAPGIVEAASRLARAMTPPGLSQLAGRGLDMTGGYVDAAADGDDAALDAVATGVGDAIGAGIDPGQLAVLSPTWAPLDRLHAVLAARGLPGVVARKAAQVWESDEARWLVSVLRVAVNPHDTLALRHAVNAFRVRVPLWLWAKARAAAASDGGTVEGALYGEATGIAPGLLDVATAIQTVRRFTFDTGITSQMASIKRAADDLRRDLIGMHLDARAARMGDVVDAVYAWARPFCALGERPSIADFLDWYATRELADTEEPEAATQPQLMTIHAAKGLEWERVWVLGCNEGDLPRHGDVEEQRRLFYVATTRAKDRVTWVVSGEPSRFVGEAMGAES